MSRVRGNAPHVYRLHDRAAYRVTIMRQHQSHTKLVYDDEHGGARGALAAALKIRDRMLASAGPRAYGQHQPLGVVKKERHTRQLKHGVARWFMWVAEITIIPDNPRADHFHMRKTFSCVLYTDAGAEALARQCVRRWCAEYGLTERQRRSA